MACKHSLVISNNERKPVAGLAWSLKSARIGTVVMLRDAVNDTQPVFQTHVLTTSVMTCMCAPWHRPLYIPGAEYGAVQTQLPHNKEVG